MNERNNNICHRDHISDNVDKFNPMDAKHELFRLYRVAVPAKEVKE